MKPLEYYLNIFSNLIISAFILLGIIVTAIGISYFEARLLWSYFVVGSPLIFVVAGLSLYFVKPSLKHNISILILSIYGSLFFVNLYLEPSLSKAVYGETFRVKDLAKAQGVKWDTRTRRQVVHDLRKK
jgi:hypothetical protein